MGFHFHLHFLTRAHHRALGSFTIADGDGTELVLDDFP
jgi:hypothetical protein